MMLYDVFYFDARTGKRLAECDFDRGIGNNFKAGKGCVAHCINTNWNRKSFWVDEKGDVIPEPQWHVKAH